MDQQSYTIIATCVIVLLAAALSLVEPLLNNPLKRSKPFIRRRYRNWMCVALSYALFYMGRYNTVILNTEGMREALQISKVQFGWITSVGFWVYAITNPICGVLSDHIGGKRAFVIGCLGSGIVNVLVGGVAVAGVVLDHFWLLLAGLSLNYLFQSFGTTASNKIHSGWYDPRERGLFGGVFSLVISSGYYLATGLGSVLVVYTPWYTVFLGPGALLLLAALLCALVVRESPQPLEAQIAASQSHSESDTERMLDIELSSDTITSANQSEALVTSDDAMESSQQQINESEDTIEQNASPKRQSSAEGMKALLRVLLRQMLSWNMLSAIASFICIGFVREGIITWFSSYLEEVHEIPFGSLQYNLVSAGIYGGGALGGILCGVISDRFFRSERHPVLCIFFILQAVCFAIMAALPNDSSSPIAAAILLILSCTFSFGIYSMLNTAVCMDIGESSAAASVTAVLTFFSYMASGLSGLLIAYLIEYYGFTVWLIVLTAASVVGAIVSAVRHASHLYIKRSMSK